MSRELDDKNNLFATVWLVRELSNYSLSRIRTTLDPETRERMIAGPDINWVWKSNMLSPRDQMRIEDAFQTQKQREASGRTTEMVIEDVMHKRRVKRVDLTDTSRPLLVSLGSGPMVFDNALKRVTRFSSRVKSVQFEDNHLIGTLERPYTQPWPVWERKSGLDRARRFIPPLSSDEFPFAPVPFRTERSSALRGGDCVSYTLTPNASGVLHATGIRVEYESSMLTHTELSRVLSWEMGDTPAFIPERFFAVAWQIRTMYETDRMRKHDFGIFNSKDAKSQVEFQKTARFRWKTMRSGMCNSVEWIYQRNIERKGDASKMIPWFTSTDRIHRCVFADYAEMQFCTRSIVDGNCKNVSRIRRVDRFQSKVARVEAIGGVTVAWLQRSEEQPEFYELEFEHLPLVIGTDDAALSALKPGQWLRYAVQFVGGETPVSGHRFYAHSAERVTAPLRCEDALDWMGEATALRKIDFVKRLTLEKLTRDLCKCTAALQLPPNTALAKDQLHAVISNASALIEVCDANLAKKPFEVKHLCDWDENDVLEWMLSIEDGLFQMHFVQIKRGIEVRRIVGVSIDKLLDDEKLQNTFYHMKERERTLLQSHVRKLIEAYFT